MDLVFRYPQAPAVQALVGKTFPNIHRIGFSISSYYKKRLGVSADIQALPLANGIEMGAFVDSKYLPPGIILVTGFPDSLLSGLLGFSLECDGSVSDRFGQMHQLLVRQG